MPEQGRDTAPESDAITRQPRWHERLWLWQKARSSLSVRIALSLCASALALLIIFALITSEQLTDSVFDNRKDAILEDAGVRFASAQSMFDQSTASSPDQVQELARRMVANVRGSAAGAGAVSVMVLRSPSSDTNFRINEIINVDYLTTITDPLRDAVVESTSGQWQSVALHDRDGSEQPGIIVGSQVNLPRAGLYEMYIIYSLKQEQNIITMVMRSLGWAVIPIAIVLPLAVFLILYHLMGPVRITSSAASRLAEGDLHARVPVTGVDEMARLGQAFNNMADSLQHRITEYDELSKLQQRFVSDVSHELRTPLTTIRMAEVMIWKDRDNLSPSTKRSAELLHEQVERFDSMLADLLEISRYDAQSALLDAESTDLRALAAKVVNDHSELAERLNAPIIIHNPENRCDAEIDSRRVERVVRNLVVNAIEHAERRPIDIDIAATDTDVALRVHDHGVGMSEETVSHVFDRFFRADPARTRTTGGTGLGLAIAREDINLHGGTIEAWGVPGMGSSFLITLPRKVGAAVASRPLELWKDEWGEGREDGSSEGGAAE